MKRCDWVTDDLNYQKYHDEEWGKPNHDDQKHFEFLILESAQAGLSWITVLRKRENYRLAFDNFDPEQVKCYDDHKIEELLHNPGIIRNRLKITAAINNAKCFLAIQEEFGSFDAYIWSFVAGSSIIGNWNSIQEAPTSTPLSDLITQELKKRGFKFLGTTIVYSFMQAMGIVNDHTLDCEERQQI